jgi:hypothetical protein
MDKRLILSLDTGLRDFRRKDRFWQGKGKATPSIIKNFHVANSNLVNYV